MTTTQHNPQAALSRLRKGMLWAAAIITWLIGVRHLLPGEAGSGGSFDAFCAFGAIETLWAYLTTVRTLKSTNLLNFAILSGVLSVSLVAGRAFCGWTCPLGAVQEGLSHLARRLTGGSPTVRGRISAALLPLRLPVGIDRPLRWLKYVILALVLLFSAFTVTPPLHSFCPLRAVFSFHLTSGLMWSVLVFFILTSLLVERVWCKILCPLGALLAIFNKISPLRLVVDASRCTGCGRCDIECSMGIRDVPDHLDDPECIRCLECLETCTRSDCLSLRVGKP